MILNQTIFCSILVSLLAPLLSSILLSSCAFLNTTALVTEKRSYRIVLIFFSASLIATLFATGMWFINHMPKAHFELININLITNYHLHLTLFLDGFSVGYLLTTSIISNLILFFSHRYLHNDPGYQRFFIIISLFYFGMNLIILAGSLDMIFAGWEVVGLSSFLLISYFWHREKAVAAASRAYYIYRISDIGLLASALITHFLWHESSIFAELNSSHAIALLSEAPVKWRWLLSLCLLLPVLGKSAQFPFCFWLPKAMEGPTHSSAIFYGSLSIHAGVFLLIRTMPIWYFTPGFSVVVGIIGLISAIFATLCAQVQSNIKGQIGYASIAQVGLMLILLSFGLVKLAFAHMIGNAVLRCFQLLVSSSILTTHLQLQSIINKFNRINKFSLANLLKVSLKPSFFSFAINEGYLEQMMYQIIVRPISFFCSMCNKFLQPSWLTYIALFGLGILLSFLAKFGFAAKIVILLLASLFAFAALGEKSSAIKALSLTTLSYVCCFFSTIIISLNNHTDSGLLYLGGLLGSSILSAETLMHIKKRRHIENIDHYAGLYQQFPYAAAILLLGLLGVIAFPFLSTFIGEDVLLHISNKNGLMFLLIFHLIFVLNGITLIRLFAKVMLGKRGNVIDEKDFDFSPKEALLRLSIFFLIHILAFWLVLV